MLLNRSARASLSLGGVLSRAIASVMIYSLSLLPASLSAAMLDACDAGDFSSDPVCLKPLGSWMMPGPGADYPFSLYLHAQDNVHDLRVRFWLPPEASVTKLSTRVDGMDASEFECVKTGSTYFECGVGDLLADTQLAVDVTVRTPITGSGWPWMSPSFRVSYNRSTELYQRKIPLRIGTSSPEEKSDHAPAIYPGQKFTLKSFDSYADFHPQVYAEDWDGDELSYTLKNINSGILVINANTGMLSIVNYDALRNQIVDDNQVPVEVMVTDGKQSAKAVVKLQLPAGESINRNPELSGLNEYKVSANISSDSSIFGQILVTDPDGDAVSLVIESGNGSNPLDAVFSLTNDGKLAVVNINAFKAHATGQFFLTIKATDARGGEGRKNITVIRTGSSSGNNTGASGSKLGKHTTSGGAFNLLGLLGLLLMMRRRESCCFK